MTSQPPHGSGKPSGLLKADKLGRDVRSRRDRKHIIGGRPCPSLFIDNASPTNLSVSRLTPKPGQAPPVDRPYLCSDAELAQISDRRVSDLKRAGKLAPNQEFRGWAELSVEDAGQDGRTVLPDPLPDNRSHAQIVLPAEAEEDYEYRMQQAAALSTKTTWRPRPPTAPPK